MEETEFETLLKEIKKLQKEVEGLRNVIDQQIKIENQMYQLMGLLGHALKEIAALREEISLLKGGE
ncbi:MAG: hypothetical protein H0Z28_10180 [Archaeoglobus sp.]|nr:hypothetical protein [Archaeoglobus sp.]